MSKKTYGERIASRTASEQDVHFALSRIVSNSHVKALNWAVNYARIGLGMTGEELRIQCLYVLNNITHWRGKEAKEVRATLKMFTTN